jgi:hypothetical protein
LVRPKIAARERVVGDPASVGLLAPFRAKGSATLDAAEIKIGLDRPVGERRLKTDHDAFIESFVDAFQFIESSEAIGTYVPNLSPDIVIDTA